MKVRSAERGAKLLTDFRKKGDGGGLSVKSKTEGMGTKTGMRARTAKPTPKAAQIENKSSPNIVPIVRVNLFD